VKHNLCDHLVLKRVAI